MATIKSYTDKEQSRKLEEIITSESADMCYIAHSELINIHEPFYKKMDKEDIPCWSLAALLSVLPKINNYRAEIREENNCFCCAYTQKDNNGDLYWYYADNPVDACVAMIEKLNELKLLRL